MARTRAQHPLMMRGAVRWAAVRSAAGPGPGGGARTSHGRWGCERVSLPPLAGEEGPEMARRGETPEPETEATFTGREALWEQAVATYFEAIPRPANTGIDSDGEHEPWRTKEKKMKTLSVGVLLCLNIGVAPPGTVRPNPCAVLECWIDPTSMPPAKAIESIGTRLQEQYVRWQPKAKCKMALDPTLDDIKKVCCSLRRRAKEEPALLHYNGHGVPRPTVNGELWVFNKNYTQYLPVSVYDLQTWMGSPSIFVYDCPGAAIIVGAFDNYAQQEYEKKKSSGSRMGNVPEPLADCIQLAACGASETLPTHPDLPADLFTSCLTTPMETALRWVFTTQHHKMLPRVTLSMIERLPGQLNDRRTMRGQLNWIFTAITDTIAWNVLPSDLFHKLFRNDLLVAALFRNFLLAERVMRSANCTPVSSPKLPPTHDHPLWQAWDMAVDYCMTQLPNILQNNAEFEHCPFFSDQLTAFEVWLEMEAHGEERKPPEQLPVVLQVLLSQQHRLRALELLERFLGLGPWAVRKALSVGIFPYVFKLLGSPAQELRPVLVSIWAKILAVDSECKMDLMKPPASVARKPASSSVSDKGFMYFVRTLAGRFEPKLRTRAAYVLATFVSENRKGQEVCLDAGLMSVTLPQLQCEDANLRQWLCLLLGQLWFKFDNARSFALQEKVLPALIDMLQDPVPKVRASAVFAMGTLVGSNIDAAGSVAAEPGKERDLNIDQIGMCLASSVLEDGSHSVRAEVVAAFCPIVLLYQNQFVSTATRMKEAKQKGRNSDRIERLLRALFYLSNDPYPDVSEAATSLLATIGIKTARKATISSKGSAKRSVNVPAHMTIRSPSPRNSFSQSWSLSGSMAAGQPSPGIMSDFVIPDTETHICGLLNTVIGLADSLDSDTPGGSELTETDVQTALRLQVMSVLDALPHLRPMLDSYGWTGVSFDGTLTSQRLRDLAMALESATNWQRNGELDLFCISSRLFSWSCASFCTWTQKEHGETPVAALERRDWRMERNTERRCEAFDVISNHKSLKLDEMMFFTRVGRVADSIVFHPYEPLVIMANQDDGVISVWNTEHPDAEFNSFSNGSPPSARITALKLVNDFDESLLAVGTSDGVVRLWQEYWTESPTLLTAWKAASKMLDAKEGQGAGLVLEWNQQSGHLLASGDVPYIQLWDCATETRVQRLSTSVRSCVTSMCVDKTNTSIVATGYGNGLIKIFDLRTCSSVQQYEQHKSFVLNVHRQHGGQRCLVSGSKAGDVLWWDERFAGAAVRSLTAYQMRKDDTMTAMAVHSHASLLAVASRKQCIKVYDLDGELLNHHRHYMNFLADPIGPTSCLAFHPFQPFLASCSYEQLVSIYAPTL